MNNNKKNLERTPLRNSNLANKPFRSPFNNNSTALKNNKLSEKDSTLSPCLKTSPVVQLEENAIKRRKLDLETYVPMYNSCLTHEDLLALKQRIRNKKLEIDSLKVKLSYRKKHNVEDLKVEIKKWQLALEKALIQYQKDCKEQFIGEGNLNMKEVILTLGIPESVVKFMDENFF
ncbi:hypothetical protein PV325_003341 [Microctonus aethiopoides]|nr:hypothetical protein PV325_003341 [Microctonus aethiopoides]